MEVSILVFSYKTLKILFALLVFAPWRYSYDYEIAFSNSLCFLVKASQNTGLHVGLGLQIPAILVLLALGFIYRR